jgi:hypothetical protein
MSDLAGKSNVEYKAKEMGVDLGANGFDSKTIVAAIKQMEDEGYQFDVADGSFQIMLEKFTEQFKPLFDLESFRVTIEKDKDLPCSAHATIKISVGDNQEITAAEGLGPVSALDNALRKALGNFYPDLDTMQLVDFKVRVVDGRDARKPKYVSSSSLGTRTRSGAPSASPKISSKPAGRPWPTVSSSNWPKKPNRISLNLRLKGSRLCIALPAE